MSEAIQKAEAAISATKAAWALYAIAHAASCKARTCAAAEAERDAYDAYALAFSAAADAVLRTPYSFDASYLASGRLTAF